jgi:hypothetical protein
MCKATENSCFEGSMWGGGIQTQYHNGCKDVQAYYRRRIMKNSEMQLL